ncbi:MAG: hypothetical protein HYX52_01475 [Chloroflexi bacterium]|nr:hypothetical protein [Chloroflexota bacterium]
MSLYQVQKAMYEYLNPRRRPAPPELTAETLRQRYGLDDAETRAILDRDVRALVRLGVHPVLLNGFARATMAIPEYRAILAQLDEEGHARG